MAGHRFKPEKASKLLDPKRTKRVQMDKILELLDIQDSDHIADLGAGNGFFTIPMAKATDGTVYAVDIEPKMLELLTERAEKENLQNIEYIVSNLEDIQLEAQSVHKAVVAFVMHEIPDMRKAIGEFKRILKPDGILVIVEWQVVESEMGPPLNERISSDSMEQLLLDNGLESKVFSLNESVYAVLMNMK